MFIVIEGLDGAGKSTQVRRVQQWLTDHGYEWEYLHFPRFATPYYGEMIARFLRGELGAVSSVDPYVVAMLYAGDRRDAASLIQGWIDQKKVVIVDRYVLSNIAYQCAKIENTELRARLKEWITGLEYDYNAIARPDLELFLDVPFRFTARKLSEQRAGDDRQYLNGKSDIHEASLDLQEAVRAIYIEHRAEHYHIIDCADSQNGQMLPIETISDKIINEIKAVL
ncbi:MAG: dTMP kinase [Mucinivorans sp.]